MEVRFVAGYDSTTGRPNRRSKDERAHSARIVRQRKKQQQQQQSGKTKVGGGKFSNPFSEPFVLGPLKPVNVKVTKLDEIGLGGEVVRYDECGSRRGSWEELDDGDDGDDVGCPDPASACPTNTLAHPNRTSNNLFPTPSPVFGALKTSTFDPSASSIAANAACYYLQCVMGNTILPSHRKTWFEAFCKDQMVFHCLSYSAFFFQDVKRVGGGEGALREVTLKHRGKALSLIGERIRQLGEEGDTDGKIEALVLTMNTLWMWSRERNGGRVAGKDGRGLLVRSSAMMPDAWLKNAFATVVAENSHALALEWLIGKVGGIERIGRLLPGLRTGLAR